MPRHRPRGGRAGPQAIAPHEATQETTAGRPGSESGPPVGFPEPAEGSGSGRPRPGFKQPLGRLSDAALSLAIVAAATLCIIFTLPGGWLLLGMLVLGLSISQRHTSNARTLHTMLLGLATAATAVDYMTWRIEVTNWAGWPIAVPLLAAELFGALHVLGLQYTVWPRPEPKLTCSEDPTRRRIFIFIPTVDEGPAVLRPTIAAALEARRCYLSAHPSGEVTIVVCNDGRAAKVANWHAIDDLARRMNVACVTRDVGGGAKAGNIEYARQRMRATGDALVVIFDADQLAKPEFLLKTVPPFADPSIGWVQTGQYYSNTEQPVARWAHDQQALFYRILCPGKATHNAAFICGTNVVIRATALDQIGGLPQNSVTEDFAASIRLHPTWRSVFLTDVLATGLGPMDLPAYLKQQRRWAIGTLSVLRTHWRAILLPRRGGLRLEQRIQYVLACTHYLCGLRDLIYIITPLAFLITGVPTVREATLALFLWHFLPYFIAAQGAFWYVARGETGLRGIIIGFGSFPALLRALLTVARGRDSGFMVTSKRRRASASWSHLVIYVVALLCCLAGVGVGVGVTLRQSRADSLTISALWVVYDIAMLASFLWMGVNDLRYAEGRAATSRSLLDHLHALRHAIARPSMQLANVAAVGAVFVSCALLVALGNLAPRPVNFQVGQERARTPYLGLSLRYESLKTTPLVFERQLCLPLAIVGRTQNITADSFDFPWAQQLAAHHQHPWITLQFGDFDADGEAPLNASLPAIANGIQDANIRRWAQAIHSYGQPIYLTILLHVDRNWSVSSAVANGGIPQDVPRAWQHVRSLFAAAGDTNVVWVWAPADPARDEAYAPPEGTIDAVLQSMIRYPDTPWPDPAAVLSAEIARHPAKPVLVEVSADGDPAEKAAWLERIAAAVQAEPRVYALLYHEGAPDLHATPTENARWSLESDDRSLQAMRTWQSLVPSATLPCWSPPLSNSESRGGPDHRGPDQPIGTVPGQVAARGRRAGRYTLWT